MIATIPLATGNKLNCFISARGMLAIVWHCVLLFCCFFLCVFFVDFLHVNKSSSQKKRIKKVTFFYDSKNTNMAGPPSSQSELSHEHT